MPRRNCRNPLKQILICTKTVHEKRILGIILSIVGMIDHTRKLSINGGFDYTCPNYNNCPILASFITPLATFQKTHKSLATGLSAVDCLRCG